MKKVHYPIILACAAASLMLTGCNKKKNTAWDEPKKESYKDKKAPLWGNSDEPLQNQEEDIISVGNEEFLAFNDGEKSADGAIAQPKDTPGELGSGLPGIDGYNEPSQELAQIFHNLYFNTDDHVLRGKDSLSALDKAADYLKEHPEIYVFVEGHCDERGPEGYNLSLGTRRANYIRSMLVQKGVDLNRIHTVSYGKERPLAFGHDTEALRKNRRAQFKIYKK